MQEQQDHSAHTLNIDENREETLTPAEESARMPSGSARVISAGLAMSAVVIASLVMRAGATAPGPLLSQIGGAYGVGAGALGLLNALPCIVFALVGLCAVPLAKRIGMSGAILAGLALSVAGLAVRPFMPTFGLFLALSALALIGPGIANVLVPAWIKRHENGHMVALITAYGTIIPLSGAAGSMFAVPLAGSSADGWKLSVGLWAAVTAVAVLVWILVWRRAGVDRPGRSGSQGQEGRNGHAEDLPADHPYRSTPMWKSPTALALTGVFGLQSLNAYVQFGFLTEILTRGGVSQAFGGVMSAAVNLWAVAGGLIMPWVIARYAKQLPLIALSFGVLMASGWVGLIYAPSSMPFLWVSLLSIGGFAFPMALALIPARSRDHLVTARLSAMVQPCGYVIAACGPVLFGFLLESSGSMSLVLSVMACSGLLMGMVGWRAAQPKIIDDEL